MKNYPCINLICAYCNWTLDILGFSMFLLSKMLRWLPPRLPHELYDCSNGFTFILYTSLTHVLRITEESIPLVEIRPLSSLKISS